MQELPTDFPSVEDSDSELESQPIFCPFTDGGEAHESLGLENPSLAGSPGKTIHSPAGHSYWAVEGTPCFFNILKDLSKPVLPSLGHTVSLLLHESCPTPPSSARAINLSGLGSRTGVAAAFQLKREPSLDWQADALLQTLPSRPAAEVQLAGLDSLAVLDLGGLLERLHKTSGLPTTNAPQ